MACRAVGLGMLEKHTAPPYDAVPEPSPEGSELEKGLLMDPWFLFGAFWGAAMMWGLQGARSRRWW